MQTLQSITITASGLQLVNLAPSSQLLAVDATESYCVLYVLTDLSEPATEQYQLLVATLGDTVPDHFSFLANTGATMVFYRQL
jgi:hypothetical protein